MRVGVGIGLATVGGPAGVCDADVVAVGCAGLPVDEVESVGLLALGCILGHDLHEREVIEYSSVAMMKLETYDMNIIAKKYTSCTRSRSHAP